MTASPLARFNMENAPDLYSYLWLRLPLVLMFAQGYLICRIFVVTRLTDIFVFRSLQKSRGRPDRICLYILVTAALLSFFIPNAVTVLILLPVLKTIEKETASQVSGHGLSTALTLSVIYGANIGGMGSLIGSPANLLLIAALDVYNVAGREHISFFNWFVWSLPLVTLFVSAAWILLTVLAMPGSARKIPLSLNLPENHGRPSRQQQYGTVIFSAFIVFWILESLLKESVSEFKPFDTPACIIFFIFFIYAVFIRHTGPEALPLLRTKDMISGFPKRGIFFLGILAAFVFIIRFSQLDRIVADWLLTTTYPQISPFIMMLSLTLIVIFLTEILSNTLVSTAFFPIAYFISDACHISPLPLMIAVSLASTCAFMTPVATPCNALAFGEMKGTSLRIMFISGFLLNIIGALLMSVWLWFIIPVIY